MRRACAVALLISAIAVCAAAQKPKEPRIQDNSLLTEEAYNQEPGVVQHISFFQRDHRTGQWIYTFTQEWPVPETTHQLSYTVPLQWVGEPGRGARVGDIALNYRYQLVGNSDAKLAATPRFTVTLPTGNWRHGEGNGAPGFNPAIAFSYAPLERWNFHFDAGTTVVPRARDSSGARTTMHSFDLGSNVVWRPASRWNAMLETWFERDGSENSLLVSPAIRWSYDYRSGLQIVPAVGFPIGVGPSAGERAVILYLSFEHPFK